MSGRRKREKDRDRKRTAKNTDRFEGANEKDLKFQDLCKELQRQTLWNKQKHQQKQQQQERAKLAKEREMKRAMTKQQQIQQKRHALDRKKTLTTARQQKSQQQQTEKDKQANPKCKQSSQSQQSRKGKQMQEGQILPQGDQRKHNTPKKLQTLKEKQQQNDLLAENRKLRCQNVRSQQTLEEQQKQKDLHAEREKLRRKNRRAQQTPEEQQQEKDLHAESKKLRRKNRRAQQTPEEQQQEKDLHAVSEKLRRQNTRSQQTPQEQQQEKDLHAVSKKLRRQNMRSQQTPQEQQQEKDLHAKSKKLRRSNTRSQQTPQEQQQEKDLHAKSEKLRRSSRRSQQTPQEQQQEKDLHAKSEKLRRSSRRSQQTPQEQQQEKDLHAKSEKLRRSNTRSQQTPQEQQQKKDLHAKSEKLRRSNTRSQQTPQEQQQEKDLHAKSKKLRRSNTRSQQTAEEQQINRKQQATDRNRRRELAAAQLTPQQLQQNKSRQASAKAHQRSTNRDHYLTFQENIGKGPVFTCHVCKRLLYEQTVKHLTTNALSKLDASIVRSCLPAIDIAVVSNCIACTTCLAAMKKKQIPKQATANNLHLVPLAEPLASLSNLEARFISQRLIFMKILALPKGKQQAIHGTVVNVPVDTAKTVSALPRTPSNAGLIPVKLKRKLSYRGHVQFEFISPKNILASLVYLKRNNKLYNDVSPVPDWAETSATEDDDLWEHLTGETFTPESPTQQTEDDNQPPVQETQEHSNEPEEEGEEEESRLNSIHYDTCLQHPEGSYQGNAIVSIAPGEGGHPVSFFADKNHEVLAFPALFPDGNFGYDMTRPQKISLTRYFNARILHCDGRFSRNTDYIFYAQHRIDIDRIQNAINIALRKAKGSQLTAGHMKDAQTLTSLVHKDLAYKFLAQIRGSPAYFDKMLLELLACVKQLGPFTWFLTLSAADLQWHETIQIIGQQHGQHFTKQQVEDMSWEDRCGWIRRNPVTAARHFDYRLQQFITYVLKAPSHPIGPIKMFMFRIEFQQRGSPHAHMAFWIENAPSHATSTDQDIAQFIDKYVSCQLPEQDDTELFPLVNKLQRHSHSPSCRKSGKKCRFLFPRPPTPDTIVIRKPKETEVETTDRMPDEEAKTILTAVYKALEEDVADKSLHGILLEIGITMDVYQMALKSSKNVNSIVHTRSLQDININNYNPTVLRLWKANMDIQFVCDAYACIMYIASYISKPERQLGDLLKAISKQCSHTDIQTQLKTVSSKFLTHREISAQEAAYRVLSLPLVYFSRQRVFVPTNPPEERIKLLKPMSVIETMDDDDDDIFQEGLLEKYAARPRKLNDMCLAQFASQYGYTSHKESDSNPEIVDEPATSSYITLTTGQTLRKRKQPAIIRTHSFSKHSDPQKYAYSLLLLYYPWTNDSQDIPFDMAEEKLEAAMDTISNNRAQLCEHVQEVDDALQAYEEDGPPTEMWGMLAPQTQQENLDAGVAKDIDPQTVFLDPNILASSDTEPSLQQQRTTSYEILSNRQTTTQWMQHIQSFNDEQSEIHNFVVQWCTEVAQSKKHGTCPKPFHIFITGGAGTGKSHLIHGIKETALRLLRTEKDDPNDILVLITAPTGTAAFNVHGQTLHSTFMLHVFQTYAQYRPLTQDKLNTLRASLSNLTILIIDEISMVSADLLLYIHRRLQEIKGNDSIFGGVSVLAFGDLYQLPPPASRALYALPSDQMSSLYGSLWQKHFHLFQLHQIMRQQNDLPFALMLNRIRTATVEEQDIITLSSRNTEEEHPDVLHVYTTNAKVDEYNKAKLHSLPDQIITVTAIDSKKDSTTNKMPVQLSEKHTQTAGLRTTLQLAVNARVMLTCNVNTADGLVNGAKGIITGFLPADTTTPDYKPKFVLVRFNNATVGKDAQSLHSTMLPQGQQTSVPIARHEASIQLGKHGKAMASRYQFPLTLAWATTIHKVQGDTLDNIVVSCDGRFQPGQFYVAVSRVRTLQGLHFHGFDPDKIKASSSTTEEMTRMQTTMNFRVPERLTTLPPHSAALTMSLINIQSIRAHFIEFANHSHTTSSHIIGVTETFLTPQDKDTAFQLQDYALFRHDRLQCTHPAAASRQHTHGGGVLLYIHDTYNIVYFLSDRLPLECVAAIMIHRDTGDRMCLAVVYRPPSMQLKHFLTQMDNIMQTLPHLNLPTIISGDFNVNLLANSSSATTLTHFFRSYGFQQIINSPTHRTGSMLDHVFSNFLHPHQAQQTVTPVHFSDHSFIQIVIPK